MKIANSATHVFGIAAGVSTGNPREAQLDPQLEVNVVLGGLKDAGNILAMAANLLAGIPAKLIVHFPQVVPYPLPLKSPQVPVELAETNLRELAAEQLVDTYANVYLCRDRSETIRQILKPESIVVLSVTRNWRRTFEERLAKLLTRDGHRVVVLKTPKPK